MNVKIFCKNILQKRNGRVIIYQRPKFHFIGFYMQDMRITSEDTENSQYTITPGKPPPTPQKKGIKNHKHAVPMKRPPANYTGTLDQAGKFISVSNAPKPPTFIDLSNQTIKVIVNELPIFIYIYSTVDNELESFPIPYKAKVWLSPNNTFECEASICNANPYDKTKDTGYNTTQVTVRLVGINLRDKINSVQDSSKRKSPTAFFLDAEQKTDPKSDAALLPRTDLPIFKKPK